MNKEIRCLWLNKKLHTKFKTKVSKDGKKLNEVVEELIKKYLNEKN